MVEVKHHVEIDTRADQLVKDEIRRKMRKRAKGKLSIRLSAVGQYSDSAQPHWDLLPPTLVFLFSPRCPTLLPPVLFSRQLQAAPVVAVVTTSTDSAAP